MIVSLFVALPAATYREISMFEFFDRFDHLGHRLE